MNIEIKDVKGNYKEISVLCDKFRKAIFQNRIEDQEGPPYTENYAKYIFGGLKYNIGAFYDNKLIGVIGASSVNGKYNQKNIKISGLGRVAIDPDYWSKKSIKEELVDYLIEKIIDGKHDVIYAALLKKEEQDDIDFLNSRGFGLIKGRKNSEALIKIVGREGLDLLKGARKMNALEYNAAKLVAGLKKADIERGKILDATSDDYDQVIHLLNNFSKKYPLARIWTKQEFVEMVNSVLDISSWDYTKLREKYPNTPFGGFFKVWKEGNEVLGAQLYYVYEVRMEVDTVPLGFWIFSVFKDDITSDEKKAFISTLIRSMKGGVAVVNAELPYYGNKDFDSAGFMGDQRPIALLLKPLTDNVEGILEERIKNYYLDIIGYNI
ncbi:MAG: hypothetical protein ACTSWR_03600 [Candidatus Helarchaeota archaeon]